MSKMTKARKPEKGLTISRARIVVNQWLLQMAQPQISTKLSHEDFGMELRKLIAPWRPDVGFPSPDDATAYVRAIAAAACLNIPCNAKTERDNTPRETPPSIAEHAKRQRELVAEWNALQARKREAERKRVFKKIAKADRDMAERMAARRAARARHAGRGPF
jgi:hypothetical protein